MGMIGDRGQMTVEFVVAFPVMIAVAVISVNAVLFISECAAFDRLAKQAICAYGTSFGYGEGSAQAAAYVQEDLSRNFDEDHLSTAVRLEKCPLGHERYVATLYFTPSLAGRPLTGSVFGVNLTPLEHSTCLTVDPYRPGALK